MRIAVITTIIMFASFAMYGQDVPIFETFHDTRIVTIESVETTPKGKFDFRIAHRFGDMFGNSGGWQSFYGMDNANDILLGFQYGISDKFMLALNRTKGAGPLHANINFSGKYRLITQEYPGNQPLSVTLEGLATYSSMTKSEVEGALNYFNKWQHRLSYYGGIYIARKFSERFSLQMNGTVTYRNIVPAIDQNLIFSLAGGLRFQATKAIGLLVDFTYPFSNLRNNNVDGSTSNYYPPIGLGFEFNTGGGHIFQVNFTNSKGLIATDYIPYTQSNWLDGEFRLGFTISRLFTL